MLEKKTETLGRMKEISRNKIVIFVTS